MIIKMSHWLRKWSGLALFMFAMSLMTACCNTDTYEITITDMESRPLVVDPNTGFAVEFDLQNPIDKEALLLEIRFIEFERITSNNSLSKDRNEQQVLDAAVVPCEDQIVVYNNRVLSMKVEVLDPDNQNVRTDITDQVVIEGSQTLLSDYIAQNGPDLGRLVIELSDTANIPDRISYVVEAVLDDGITITTSGGIINFN